MTDESDFDEHLRAVVRKRQSRQAADDELAEDRLSLSGNKVGEGDRSSPRERRFANGNSRNERLIWVAMGLGGAALVITLILGALVYRQSGYLSRLDGAVSSLEEQMEANNPLQIGSGLQADIAQLNARMNAMTGRLAQLEQERTTGVPADGELQERIDRLNETVSQLQARLASLETKAATGAKPVATKPVAKGWYVVLASLADADAAKKLQQRYRQQGVEAGVQLVKVKGVRRYRLRVGPFANAGQARRQAEKIKRKLKLTSVWLSR